MNPTNPIKTLNPEPQLPRASAAPAVEGRLRAAAEAFRQEPRQHRVLYEGFRV